VVDVVAVLLGMREIYNLEVLERLEGEEEVIV
jgi:hypothetical protein